MKRMIFLFSVILSLSAIKTAEARSIIAAQAADLYDIVYGDTAFIGGSGSVKVDHLNQEVTVTLNQKAFICPPRAMCSIPRQKILKGKLLLSKVGVCGGRVYHAEDNKMIVDGINLSITVVDWRGYTCHDREVPAADTIVTTSETWMNRVNGEVLTRKGTFYGSALKAVSPSRVFPGVL